MCFWIAKVIYLIIQTVSGLRITTALKMLSSADRAATQLSHRSGTESQLPALHAGLRNADTQSGGMPAQIT